MKPLHAALALSLAAAIAGCGGDEAEQETNATEAGTPGGLPRSAVSEQELQVIADEAARAAEGGGTATPLPAPKPTEPPPPSMSGSAPTTVNPKDH